MITNKGSEKIIDNEKAAYPARPGRSGIRYVWDEARPKPRTTIGGTPSQIKPIDTATTVP
jgi:hypothetical protein